MLLMLLFSLLVGAEDIKVAVLDTGFNENHIKDIRLCPNGLKDFTGMGTTHDHDGHGTNVTAIINKYNKNPKVCFMLLKVFGGENNLLNTISAIFYAIEHNVKVINYSGGGYTPDDLEKRAVKLFLDRGGIFVAAVGNKALNLNYNCRYFPACYDTRIFVVSNRQAYSNIYAKSAVSEYDGRTETFYGVKLKGTSQSAAYGTAALLNVMMVNSVWKQ